MAAFCLGPNELNDDCVVYPHCFSERMSMKTLNVCMIDPFPVYQTTLNDIYIGVVWPSIYAHSKGVEQFWTATHLISSVGIQDALSTIIRLIR